MATEPADRQVVRLTGWKQRWWGSKCEAATSNLASILFFFFNLSASYNIHCSACKVSSHRLARRS
ncbi:hypothetical protein E2C01_068101 [Portunus trituberculatus]|uniref:Uncharacterized protein n=1 Tax=Portunus trituberculatus TaxID=210409 RepID=A0A5B7HZ68_PORTR|nr:hypothetical protein [Portunus trituberculatus]